VTLSFAAWKPGAVQPATVEVPVHLIEAVESARLTATLKGHEDAVSQVAWARDGNTLATLSIGKGEVKLWQVAERKERATLRSDVGNSYSLAFTPDGKALVLGHHKSDVKAGPTGGISIWDVATAKQKGLLQHPAPRGVTRLALTHDGNMIAASESWKDSEIGVHKTYVALWDVATGKAHPILPDETTGVLVFSPNGNILAWTGYVSKGNNQITGAVVHRRDLTKEQDLPVLRAGMLPLSCLAFSPDGGTLAGADYQGNISLWDTASAKVRTTIKQEGGRRISSLAFAPDGKTLAAAVGNRPGRDHETGLIVLWDAVTGHHRLTLTGHTNAVLSVAFSPDGKVLASGGSDRTVRLWDMKALPATGAASGGR
jgi:WD40 repeat protein